MLSCDADCRDWIRTTIAVLAIFSFFLAYRTYKVNLAKTREDRERERDKEFVSQFRTSLEWAYNVLTDGGKSVPPEASRLNWLTSARHILRAKRIRSHVTHPTYQAIADEAEEFWRHKFYQALSDRLFLRESYFTGRALSGLPEGIEPKSALVVVQFSNWEKSAKDPLDSVSREELIAQGALDGLAGHGLAAYIRTIEEKRAELSGEDVTPESKQSS